MELLKIKTYPDEVLIMETSLVKTVNNSIKKLINNMAYTMYKFQGIGIAAPQVGISKKIIVYNDIENKEVKFSSIINPKIIKKEKEIISEDEGCLSLPGLRTNVKRFEKIIIKGIDIYEKPILIKLKGFLSIVVQHEIDHLNGILLINKLSSLKKLIYKKRLIKKLKKR